MQIKKKNRRDRVRQLGNTSLPIGSTWTLWTEVGWQKRRQDKHQHRKRNVNWEEWPIPAGLGPNPPAETTAVAPYLMVLSFSLHCCSSRKILCLSPLMTYHRRLPPQPPVPSPTARDVPSLAARCLLFQVTGLEMIKGLELIHFLHEAE